MKLISWLIFLVHAIYLLVQYTLDPVLFCLLSKHVTLCTLYCIRHWLPLPNFHNFLFSSYANNFLRWCKCHLYYFTRKVLENIQRQEQSTGLHEQFHSQVGWLSAQSTIVYITSVFSCTQLQRSSDGFSVVAEYFGRGVFGKVSLRKYF